MSSSKPAGGPVGVSERPTLPRLAAVAVTFNSSKEIEDWVAAFEATSMRDEIELCVVDSGSAPDERRFLVERIGPRVDHLVLRPNRGYGRSCNVGAAHTTAETLLFLNPDAELVSLPSEVSDAGVADGALLGAVKLFPDGRRLPLGFTHLPHARWQAESLLLGRFSRAYRFTGERPAWVSGAAMLVKRSDFEAIGGFSPEMFLYFEDADLCARHLRRGGRVEVDPEFVVKHPGLTSGRRGEKGLDPVSKWSGRIFAANHGGPLQARLLYLLLIFCYLPRRTLVALVRRVVHGPGREPVGQLALDLLNVRRVLRRLGVPD